MVLLLYVGLDATSMELTGQLKWNSLFEAAYSDLLSRVLTGRIVIFVSERFDESVVILTRILNNMYGHPNSSDSNGKLSL